MKNFLFLSLSMVFLSCASMNKGRDQKDANITNGKKDHGLSTDREIFIPDFVRN